MGKNTPSRSPSPLPPPLPQFEWLKPTIDAPRLSWESWLALSADQLAHDYPGEVGLFLSSVVGALSHQARELGAISPAEHERLAEEEADRAAAWLQALQAEAAQPGVWTITENPEADPGYRPGSC